MGLKAVSNPGVVAGSDGVGDVVGPASSTNNAVAKFDGTTGKLLKDGVVLGTIATQDANNVGPLAGITTLAVSGNAAFDTSVLFVDAATNKVGVRTTNPQEVLHVNGPTHIRSETTTHGFFALNPGGVTTQGYLEWFKPGPTRLAYIGYLDSAGSANNVSVNLENSANFLISGGNLGIKTAVPDKALEINLGTADAVRLTYNDANGSAATYMDTTLSSAGVTTFTGAGSAPAFSFAQAVTFAARANHASFTVATAPAVGVAGGHVYFADAAGSPCWGQSNGSLWKRCDDTSVTVT